MRSAATSAPVARKSRSISPARRGCGSLQCFLVASICTIARPGAVCDISVARERQQWSLGSDTIDLNPHGRAQNKKRRPVLSVMPLLDEWLQAEWDEYQALPEKERVGRGWLVNYYGRPVQDVDRVWNTMLTLRHSLATPVRNRGAARWDLEGFIGHRAASQTETYAIGEFLTVVTALNGIIAELHRLTPGSLHRNDTGASRSFPQLREIKMPG